MEYEHWRDDIFGHPEGSDPVMVDLKADTYNMSDANSLDFIDRSLTDPEIHDRYSPAQIGIGLNIIYNNSCSDIPFCYVNGDGDSATEARKVAAIGNLGYLYSNFFNRYCTEPVNKIGYFDDLTPMNYICYMLWDIFVLYPPRASNTMVEAAIAIMRESMRLENDNCLVSVIHGLGHWSAYTNLAAPVLEQWLCAPTSDNEVVIDYAKNASSGCIQ